MMIGRFKSRPAEQLAGEYVARLNRMHPCRLSHLRPPPYRDETKDAPAIRASEATAILDRVPDGSWCVALERTGRAMDTLALARRLERELVGGRRRGVFVVGGFLGLDDRVRQRADLEWSLTPLTLPHELAVVVLAEQLYRAVTITRGIPYHK